MTQMKDNTWHKALTIAVTVMVVAIGLLIASNLRLTSQHQKTEVALAVLAESVLTHNVAASGYIEQIKDHEVRLVKLETSGVSKEEMLRYLDTLKKDIEDNYQRK